MSQLPIGNSGKRSLHSVKCKDAYTAESKNLAQIARRKLGTAVPVKCQKREVQSAVTKTIIKQKVTTPSSAIKPPPQLTAARKKSISMVDLSPETDGSVDKRFLLRFFFFYQF